MCCVPSVRVSDPAWDVVVTAMLQFEAMAPCRTLLPVCWPCAAPMRAAEANSAAARGLAAKINDLFTTLSVMRWSSHLLWPTMHRYLGCLLDLDQWPAAPGPVRPPAA